MYLKPVILKAAEAEVIEGGKSPTNSSYLLLKMTACLRWGLITPWQHLKSLYNPLLTPYKARDPTVIHLPANNSFSHALFHN
jgi:hypothetical protein